MPCFFSSCRKNASALMKWGAEYEVEKDAFDARVYFRIGMPLEEAEDAMEALKHDFMRLPQGGPFPLEHAVLRKLPPQCGKLREKLKGKLFKRISEGSSRSPYEWEALSKLVAMHLRDARGPGGPRNGERPPREAGLADGGGDRFPV